MLFSISQNRSQNQSNMKPANKQKFISSNGFKQVSNQLSLEEKQNIYKEIIGDNACKFKHLKNKNDFSLQDKNTSFFSVINPSNKLKVLFDLFSLIFIMYDIIDVSNYNIYSTSHYPPNSFQPKKIPMQIAFDGEII
jgi:hypothetical protein